MGADAGTTLRRAKAADAAAVADLLDRFNREYATPTPGPQALSARLEVLLADDSTVALLAGEPPVGVALLTLRANVWFSGPVGLLDELYVVPGQRGRGVGAQLLKAAEDECRRVGCRLLEVNVDGEDTDARRFYERHGYTDRDPGQRDSQLYYHREL